VTKYIALETIPFSFETFFSKMHCLRDIYILKWSFKMGYPIHTHTRARARTYKYISIIHIFVNNDITSIIHENHKFIKNNLNLSGLV